MVKFNNGYYFGYAIALAVSFVAPFVLPIDEMFKGIVALPGVGALCLLLNQLWRDNRAHDRALELQLKQQDFVLATASHMADVAYDKHVEFCEEYMSRVQKSFQELLRDGPSRNALNIGRELVNIRQKHSAWLTKEIESNLHPFEQALIKMGAKESYLSSAKLSAGDEITSVVEEIHKYFELIMHIKDAKNIEEEEVAIDTVIEIIRGILGINILTELRLRAAELALKRVNS